MSAEWQGPTGAIDRAQLDDVFVAAVRDGFTEIPQSVEMNAVDSHMVQCALGIISTENAAQHQETAQTVRTLVPRNALVDAKTTDAAPRAAPIHVPSEREVARHAAAGPLTLVDTIVMARALERRKADRSSRDKVSDGVGKLVTKTVGERGISKGDVELTAAARQAVTEAYGRDQARNYGTTATPLLWHLAARRASEQHGNVPALALGIARSFETAYQSNANAEGSYPQALRDYRLAVARAQAQANARTAQEIQQAAAPRGGPQGIEYKALDANLARDRAVRRMQRFVTQSVLGHTDSLAAKEKAAAQQKRADAEEAARQKQHNADRAQHEVDSSHAYGREVLRSPTDLVERLRGVANRSHRMTASEIINSLAALREQARAGLTTPSREFPKLWEIFELSTIRHLHRSVGRIQDGFGTPAELLLIDSLNSARWARNPEIAKMVDALRSAFTQAAARHFGQPVQFRDPPQKPKTNPGLNGQKGGPSGRPVESVYSPLVLDALRAGYVFDMTNRGNPRPGDDSAALALGAIMQVRGQDYVRAAHAAEGTRGLSPLPANMRAAVAEVEAWGRDMQRRHRMSRDSLTGLWSRFTKQSPGGAQTDERGRPIRGKQTPPPARR